VERELTVRRRRIGSEELGLIRQLITQEGHRGRTHLSRRLCQIWDWRQANGHFRQIACRDLLRQLHAKGLIELPPTLRGARRVGYKNRVREPELLDRVPLEGSLGHLANSIVVQRVEGAPERQVFKGLIGTYHYLGYQQPTGAQIQYLAYHEQRPIGCLSFGPAAYKVAARDQFIGWSVRQRQERLPLLVNNDRFLLLPWIHIRFLASWLLSRCLRRLRWDWQQVYRQDLVLCETFIEQERFRGSSYAAANWICVGRTQGRGRNDRFHRAGLAIKSVWLYPLCNNFAQRLCTPLP